MKYTGVFYTVFMVQITTVAKISQSTMFYDSSNFQMTVKYETIAEGGEGIDFERNQFFVISLYAARLRNIHFEML